MVGPFVLFDQMGPAVFDTGRGFDMGPHPHIGLAAVTYLIDGEIVHRDSLGKVQALRPGASNRQRPIGANAVSPKCQGRANLFLCRRI
jgi:redox-sensitive bicupin YhaK (pirin superfamily)